MTFLLQCRAFRLFRLVYKQQFASLLKGEFNVQAIMV